MKAIIAFAVSIAIGLAPATAPAAENQAERSGAYPGSMPGMTQGPATEMMRGMPMGTPGHAPGWERPQLSFALQNRSELGLSAEQEKALRALVERFGNEADQRTRDIDAAERELAALLKQEPVDFAQIEAKVRGVATVRADLRLSRIRTIAEGRAALTSEQRAKLDQLAAGKGRMGQREGTRGAEEMQRFMNSERMPQAMNAMMAMAERMGGGDMMLGMVRMMEMMSMMGGGIMGGSMMGADSMMGNTQRPIQENK